MIKLDNIPIMSTDISRNIHTSSRYSQQAIDIRQKWSRILGISLSSVDHLALAMMDMQLSNLSLDLEQVEEVITALQLVRETDVLQSRIQEMSKNKGRRE